MKMSGNTILITGGSDGIGLELANLLADDNTVIVCGRNESKLATVNAELPEVKILVCDVTIADQREDMIKQVVSQYPDFNMLINNAGGRTLADLQSGADMQSALTADMALNFTAPVELCNMVLPHLLNQPVGVLVNITTGLVHLPKTAYPFYCAAKAALHSYTQSLRWVLWDTTVSVFEIQMPLVDTNFHQGALPNTVKAMNPRDAARKSLAAIGNNRQEAHIGITAVGRWLAFFAPRKGMAVFNR